jgi:hypothetical protein
MLDTPEIRSALPPVLLSAEAPHPWVEAFKRGFLRFGIVWIAIGALLLTAVVVRMARAAAKPHTRRSAVIPAPETVDLHNA